MENNLVKDIAEIRGVISETKFKKSGKSPQGHEYFKIEDFLPVIVKEMSNRGIIDIFKVDKEKGEAVMSLSNGTTKIDYNYPIDLTQIVGMDNNTKVAGISSYARKMLYINIFGIAESLDLDEAPIDLKDSF